jgi:hypothetical protein
MAQEGHGGGQCWCMPCGLDAFVVGHGEEGEDALTPVSELSEKTPSGPLPSDEERKTSGDCSVLFDPLEQSVRNFLRCS